MGNYRFKLSDMMPNAWFYKLKDMSSKSRNQNLTYHCSKKKPQQTSSSNAAAAAVSSKDTQPHLSNQRKSYYFSRNLSVTPSHDEHGNETFYDNVETKTRISDNHSSEPPRKSSKKRRSTRRSRVSNRASPKTVTSTSVAAGCSCRATAESVLTKPDSTPEEYPNSPIDSSSENEPFLAAETFDGVLSFSASCRCRIEKDIVIDIENKPLNEKFQELADKVDGYELQGSKALLTNPELFSSNHVPSSIVSEKVDGFDTITQLNLPPVITNPRKSPTRGMETLPKEPTRILETSPKGRQKTTSARRFSANPHGGLKLRTNSPRIVNRKIQGRKCVSSSSSSSSRSMSDSFAVVKSSKDPQRDFRESMVEMIIENNLSASKDLEDLLASYLSLNSDEYHDLIIKVFKQIWFDIVDIHHK